MTNHSTIAARLLILAGSCLVPLTFSLAAEADAATDATAADATAPAAAEDQHDRPGNDIVVTGILQRNRVDALSGVAIL